MHLKLLRHAYVLVVPALCGCATTVGTKADLFQGNAAALEDKHCYAYDTLQQGATRVMPRTVSLAVIGGLVPPLGLITVLTATAANMVDAATLPEKCGLTVDDAVKEAWTVSFDQQETALWSEKGGTLRIAVKPLAEKDDCAIHEISLTRGGTDSSRKFVENVQICKAQDGTPRIVAHDLSPEAVEKWKHPDRTPATQNSAAQSAGLRGS